MLSAAANQPVADTRGKLFESVAEYVFKEVGCPVRKNLTSPLASIHRWAVLADFPVFGLSISAVSRGYLLVCPAFPVCSFVGP